MPSPFPGMDPYLEAHWRDVHSSLVIYIRDAIQDQLPRELRARVEERERTSNGHCPDVPERFLQVLDRVNGNGVVTVIEVLSPADKLPGPRRERYLSWRGEWARSDTNLVEIDLLRCGEHTIAALDIPAEHRTPYAVCVARASRPGQFDVYPAPLSRRLPIFRMPLRKGDTDVAVALQPLIEQVYQRGRYEVTLDYDRDPDPPLTGEDADWADRLLRDKGLRKGSA